MTMLLTVEEVAAALHNTVTISAVRDLIKGGQLPVKRIGKRQYVSRHVLEEFIRCPDRESPPAFTGESEKSSGSSETEASSGGQAAALASARKLKNSSASTSRESPSPVVRLDPTKLR